MSYLRGDTYIWNSGERFHVWVTDGYDSWAESVWAEHCKDSGDIRPSGVAVSINKMDEFVLMRLAEMLDEHSIDSAIDRALANGKGNGGCEALVKNAEALKSALKQLQ
ncbi:MAG: hypothetical protein ACKVRN_10935 [Pyrinomonadaceae bacterium]